MEVCSNLLLARKLNRLKSHLPFDFQRDRVLSGRQQTKVVALRIEVRLSGALHVHHGLDVRDRAVLLGVQDEALHSSVHLRHEVHQ